MTKAWRVHAMHGSNWVSFIFANTRTEAKKIWFDERHISWSDIIIERAENLDGYDDGLRILAVHKSMIL